MIKFFLNVFKYLLGQKKKSTNKHIGNHPPKPPNGKK